MHDPDTTPAGSDSTGPAPEELEAAAQRLSEPTTPEDAPQATDEDLELGSATHVVLDGDVIRVDTATGQAPPDDEAQNVDRRDQVPSDEVDDADETDETKQAEVSDVDVDVPAAEQAPTAEADQADEQDGDSK